MFKAVLFIFCLLTFNKVISQIDHIEVLLLRTDKEIITYLDSLNKLKQNPYSKIKKDLTDRGDIVLKNDFAISDESFFKCFAVYAVLQRVDGVEVCVKQVVLGSADFASFNLSYLKDKFVLVSENKWEYSPADTPYKFQALLKVTHNEVLSTYSITYSIERK